VMRFLLRPSTHAYRGLLDFALRALLVSSKELIVSLRNGNSHFIYYPYYL